MTKYVRGLAMVGVLTLTVAACGSKPAESGSSAAGAKKDFNACMVSDSGGFDDKSFNQTSYKGLQDAVKNVGVNEKKAESKSDNDYPTNMNAMVAAKCNIIVPVGFKLADATETAAKANPDIKFAIVDFNGFKAPLPNVKPLVFNTAQSSFLAGYLAAGMSKSGKVGTFGGANIPTVTIFMDGYAEGVAHYNKLKGKKVQVVGWDAATQKGLFTGDFEATAKGQQNAQNLITQGADIIFPVAGPAGVGGLQAAKASGGKVNAIWVDTDGCVSAAEYCDVLLTSVFKGMDLAVENAIKAASEDKFSNEEYVGTLENNGTGLSPYHDWDTKIPADLKTEIDQLKKDLISGTVKVASKAQP